MNPNYYRGAVSPQQSGQSSGGTATASQRDHAARAMYQNPYGAAHADALQQQMRMGSVGSQQSLQIGSPFGFPPGTGPFFQAAPGGYHLVSAADMARDMQQQQQQQQQQQRSVSPPRRRPTNSSNSGNNLPPETGYHDRERYLRAMSPPGNHSPVQV